VAVYTQTVLSPDPLYLQPKTYDARADRKALADIISAGVRDAGDFAVTATTANMNISIAAGNAYILGQNITEQGMYRQYNPSNVVMTVPGNSSGNPRIDTVIIRVMDHAADSSGFSEGRIEIVPGTATTGADLNNLNGKANLTTLGEASKSVLVLCYLLIPNGATSLTTVGNVKDARIRASVGSGLASGGTPIGSTIEWNGASVPVGGFYLTEDGSAISRSVYSIAFGILGTLFGGGDGSTTFNIPDSRGRVPVGYAPSGGHADVNTVGKNDGIAVASRRTKHKHTVAMTDPGHNHTIPGFVGSVSGPAGGAVAISGSSTSGTSVTGLNASNVLIGPQTGAEPNDGPAYIVKHKILRVA
jgi:microcystin-dependent protein